MVTPEEHEQYFWTALADAEKYARKAGKADDPAEAIALLYSVQYDLGTADAHRASLEDASTSRMRRERRRVDDLVDEMESLVAERLFGSRNPLSGRRGR